MKKEHMPSDNLLEICKTHWAISDISFVRKMENAVYAAKRLDQTVYLRLTTPFRRSKAEIEAEITFLKHLTSKGFNVPTVIPSKAGKDSITLTDDNHQIFEAVLFTGIQGQHPSLEILGEPNYLKKLGALVATLHDSSINLDLKREHWYEERGLRHAIAGHSLSNNKILASQLSEKIDWLKSLDTTSHQYGLVHLDLGAENLLIDPHGNIGIIDFDDACYHFHQFDLAIIIYSMALRHRSPTFSEQEETWLSHLLSGYQTIRTLSDEQIQQIPQLIEFACLRLYFWIEYHKYHDTFHEAKLTHAHSIQQWAKNRLLSVSA